jgi:hypothetical protein
MILLLPVMGLMSLFSQVHMQYQPAVMLGGLIIIAMVLTRWSLLRASH